MRSLVLAGIAALAFASTLTVAAQQVTKETVPGVTNFARLETTVACAGAIKVEAIPEIKKLGYASIINLRQPSEQGANVPENTTYAKEIGLNYINIPFNAQAPDSKAVDTFLGLIANKANQPVYVHCGSASRVGSMWMIKRVLQDGWALDKATEEAKLIGLRSPALEQFAVEYINSHKK